MYIWIYAQSGISLNLDYRLPALTHITSYVQGLYSHIYPYDPTF